MKPIILYISKTKEKPKSRKEYVYFCWTCIFQTQLTIVYDELLIESIIDELYVNFIQFSDELYIRAESKWNTFIKG